MIVIVWVTTRVTVVRSVSVMVIVIVGKCQGQQCEQTDNLQHSGINFLNHKHLGELRQRLKLSVYYNVYFILLKESDFKYLKTATEFVHIYQKLIKDKIKSRINMDPWEHERLDQLSSRCKYPLLTGHTLPEIYTLSGIRSISTSTLGCKELPTNWNKMLQTAFDLMTGCTCKLDLYTDQRICKT